MSKKYVYNLPLPIFKKMFYGNSTEVAREQESFLDMLRGVGEVVSVDDKNRIVQFALYENDYDGSKWQLFEAVHDLYEELSANYGPVDKEFNNDFSALLSELS